MQSLVLDLLRSRRRRPLVLAHRGDSIHAPENTLEAAMLGWEAGAEAWELDVQLTRDGVAVVFHDETLSRTTDVADRFGGDPRGRDGFRLADFDWCEIASLDAGSWFVADAASERSAAAFGTLENMDGSRRSHYRSGRVRVPTLVAALMLTADRDWLVNVEIKSFPGNPPGIVEAVLDAITQTGTASRVLLSSFDHRDIARIPCLIPPARHALLDIPRGILVATPLFRPHAYLAEIVGAQTFHASAKCLGSESIGYRHRRTAEALWSDGIAELRSRGIPILVYTVNDHQPGGLAEHFAELGVAGLFTDDPVGMRSHFG
ncbi:MAG TPA: glycerophosphodiester phosphodiesterase family protein [Isosphaeraceae bacterium]|nr:glycerophosphodiester phosphodiesterase family protein [Isosphaeraceae bacterium]